MAFLLQSHSISILKLNKLLLPSSTPAKRKRCRLAARRGIHGTQALFNPFEDQPILKDALKEPVAFMGGMFAGLLRLDLNEEPLKEWITRTAEAAGVDLEVTAATQGSGMDGGDDEPQQIEIE